MANSPSNPVVYPNPVSGSTVTLQLPKYALSNVIVQIFTQSFRKVETINVSPAAGNALIVSLVDKSGVGLANGLYYFVVCSGDRKWVNKVLVLH